MIERSKGPDEFLLSTSHMTLARHPADISHGFIGA